MQFINGNITDITSGIICHQVNCQGVMGAGVALAIRKKWLVAYSKYMQASSRGELVLGNVIFVKIQTNLCVAHICGQDRYGRTDVYTDYKALDKAIRYISEVRMIVNKDMKMAVPVYFPNKMGCGLAGGDWNIVIQIIGKYIPDAKIINYIH
jgi:O-acetyl-ADP-ribose deacetylase (regulator of RNase III)